MPLSKMIEIQFRSFNKFFRCIFVFKPIKVLFFLFNQSFDKWNNIVYHLLRERKTTANSRLLQWRVLWCIQIFVFHFTFILV